MSCPPEFFRPRKSPSRQGLKRHGERSDSCRPLPIAFVVEEVKRFVFDDRAADIAAELIALEAALFDARTVAEKVIGVQRAVPMEFKERPMKIVRTALGNQVDDAAARAPEFGAESIGLNAEFLHRIHRRRVSEIKDRNVVFGADVGNAVNRDFTGSVTPAADRRRRPAD